MGRNGDKATIAEAKKRLAEHISGTNKLPADLRTPVGDDTQLKSGPCFTNNLESDHNRKHIAGAKMRFTKIVIL